MNKMRRMPNAANELTGKQQLPTATPANAAVNRINFLLVYFTGIFFFLPKLLWCWCWRVSDTVV